MSRFAVLPVLVALFLGACGGGDDGEPEITEAPKTPIETAERWLELWKDNDYEAMYGLVSSEARATIDEQSFVDRYAAITEEARITGLDYEIPGQDPAATEIGFKITFQTSFFGDIPQNNTLPMIKETVARPAESGETNTSEEWRVVWAPSLFFKELDDESLVHFFTRVPRRGSILDREGQPLALDADLPVVGFVPDYVTDKEALIAQVSSALGMSDADVRSIVETDQPSYYFIPIKTLPYGTPTEEVQKFRDMVGLGVVVRDQTQRLYPHGSAAAHVLGYMTEVTEEQLGDLKDKGYGPGDLIGAAGLEEQYDEMLAGERGALLATVAPEGTIGQTIAEKVSAPGKDIVLAIDIDVQKRAEQELGEKVGSIVVMDPRDNSVLALASYPRFDPNAFIRGLTGEEANALFNDPRQPFLNRPLLAEYAPGSTFKTVTLAAGLEKAGYTPNSSIPCPPVWTGLGEQYAQKNWQTVSRGNLTPSEGLMASCNPVFFEMGKSLDEIDENVFPEFARQFGYGSATGIGMEEADGNIPDPAWKEENVGEAWFRGDAVNMAIGQGFVTATPMQIANAYSAMALSGVLKKPLLVMRIGTAGQAAYQEFAAEEIHPLPVSSTTLDAIRYGMYLVTQSAGGTSYQAWAGTSLDVAGKSGTAEDLTPGFDHVFFVAYANRSNPTIVALGSLEEGQSGSAEVAPMLRRLMEAYMRGELTNAPPG